MNPVPPVREDGRCAQCGKPRNAKWNKYGGDQALLDPFCSTTCCRAYHANPLPEKSIWGKVA